MTTISAKIIADSISRYNSRITTMQLRYPRFIHAEFMTHRQFSRNASSSRAIPVAKLMADVMADPAEPLVWGTNQAGMQAGEPLELDALDAAKAVWHSCLAKAVISASELAEIGAHKQIVNRILEPFSHIEVVVTATEWHNFFALRCHPAAEPHIRLLAERMREVYRESDPRFLKQGGWHLPYITDDEINVGLTETLSDLVKMSVARCARVSYLTHDRQTPKPADDLALYERLVGSRPLHASPAEHQATPDGIGERGWANAHLHGNLRGWIQHRKTLVGECAR